VRLLQCPLSGATDQTHLIRVFRGAYDVLYTYMIGNSRKNALYFAKYIDFFQTQITVKAVQSAISFLFILPPYLAINSEPDKGQILPLSPFLLLSVSASFPPFLSTLHSLSLLSIDFLSPFYSHPFCSK